MPAKPALPSTMSFTSVTAQHQQGATPTSNRAMNSTKNQGAFVKAEKQENANEDPNSFSTLVARYHSAPSLGGGSSHH
jgi:hypothetical protein